MVDSVHAAVNNETTSGANGDATASSGATEGSSATSQAGPAGAQDVKPVIPPTQKRLHVSNIPFRFREPDLRAMFGVSKFHFVKIKILNQVSWII